MTRTSFPLKITLRHTDPSLALEEEITKRAERLGRFNARPTKCEVLVEAPGNHHRSGATWRVRIDLAIPGHEIVVDKEPDEDPYVAVRRAFDAAARQVHDLQHRRNIGRRHERT